MVSLRYPSSWFLAAVLCALLGVSACAGPSKAARAQKAQRAIPAKAKAVVRTAKTYLPEEEQGRKRPKDCSDYTQRVFAEHGLELPRTSQEQSLLGKRVDSPKKLRMGDLVFFSGEKISRIVGHVGIYVNNGIFIHFPSTKVVSLESLWSDYYRARYLTGRRLIK